MSTYFGHKPRWKQMHQPSGGPLAPPTRHPPVRDLRDEPRGRRMTLPGPGPRAGGRYHVWNNSPRENPIGFRYNPVAHESEDWQRWTHDRKMRGLAFKYGRFNPAMRIVGTLLDTDWSFPRSGSEIYPFDLGSAGFIKVKECEPVGGPVYIPGVPYSGPDNVGTHAAADPNLVCTLTGQVPQFGWDAFTGVFAWGTAPSNTRQWIAFGPYNQGSVGRMQIREQWWRPGTGPIPVTPWRPLGKPMPMPHVLTPPAAQERVRQYPKPEVESEPMGVTSIRLTPRGPVKVPTTFKPPLPGNEEWKVRFMYGPIGDVYGWLTEIGDGMDCLIRAIQEGMPTVNAGGRKRPKPYAGKTMQDKAAYIVQYRRFIDWNHFIDCMVISKIKDRMIGRFSRAASQAATRNPYWKRPVGPGAGGWGTRHVTMTPM